MKNFFGTLRFMLAKANDTHIMWCVLLLMIMLTLAILHRLWRGDGQKIKLWKKLCFAPFIITTVHYFVYVSGASGFLRNYTPMYLMALLAFVPLICEERKRGYKVAVPIAGALAVVLGVYFCLTSVDLHNFSKKSYTASFEALVTEMNKSYVLKEWKNVDFYALKDKYMPLVEEAERERDPARFADAVTMFCNELHDGHVAVYTRYDRNKYTSALELHDYGLAMIQLDDGKVIAVCTGEEVNRLGIKDGTVITKWNGKPVLQAAAEDVSDAGVPASSNADRLAFIDLSATGGTVVSVSFIDGAGGERTVELTALAEEHTLDDAYSALSHSPEKRQELLTDNFGTRMLDSKTGYLSLTALTTGNVIRDNLGFFSGESKWAKEMFRKKLRGLKEQGMQYLIIDLRNNIGGYDEIGIALCELLTTEDMFASGLGIRRYGEYIGVTEKRIRGDGEFADLKAVALTNFNCVSGGDVTARYLSRLPNVTLAGITDPCGSGQMTGGCCVLSGGIVEVSYPIGLTLDENGEPNIDPKADRISRDPVEQRIPLDYNAAMKIFRDKSDYELEWAASYLKTAE